MLAAGRHAECGEPSVTAAGGRRGCAAPAAARGAGAGAGRQRPAAGAGAGGGARPAGARPPAPGAAGRRVRMADSTTAIQSGR
jgi:hypothetical protein